MVNESELPRDTHADTHAWIRACTRERVETVKSG